MTFQPIIPLTGYAGFAFLQRTLNTQQIAYNSSASIQQDTDYFLENIGNIDSAEDLINDRRLLTVALGAFDLSDDINNKYFLQKILEEGTLDTDSLANKLADTRYQEFAREFGFGDFSVPNTKLSSFGSEIVERYQTIQFEVAVGQQNDDFRLAMNAVRNLNEIASDDLSIDGKWFSIMGNAPLRSVFETAFGLPTSFSQLDLDQQVSTFKEKAENRFGSEDPSIFAQDSSRDEVVKLFLLQSELNSFSALQSSKTIALQLLQS